MTKVNHRLAYVVASVMWLCAIVFILVVPTQSDFLLLAIAYPIALLAYGFFNWKVPSATWFNSLLLLGIVVRVAAIFIFPQLSDDIYRFIWDGRLTHLGLQVYAYLPVDIVQQYPDLDKGDILSKMNSPEYYTVYPPISQVVFYLSTWLDLSISSSSMIIKSLFLIAELVTLWFSLKILKVLKLPSALVLLYWTNPLIIIEGIGNLHFEIIMIAFLAASLYYWQIDKYNKSMVLLSVSIGAKLLSALVLPYLLWNLTGKKRLKVLIVFTISLLLIFSPILIGFNYSEFLSSIDLYFRKFEFNASIYYLLRWIGLKISGYNLIAYIGPLLGLAFLIFNANFTVKGNAKNAFVYLYYVFLVYLFCATTVHPWYLSVPIFCSIFVRSRIAVIWSCLIWLTYINYSYDPYYENLWIVFAEYSVVAVYTYIELRNQINWKTERPQI